MVAGHLGSVLGSCSTSRRCRCGGRCATSCWPTRRWCSPAPRCGSAATSATVATSLGLKPAEEGAAGRRRGRAVARARRRLAVRLRQAGDPLRRPPPAAAGPRRARRGPARRDRRAGRRRRGPHPRAVLEPAGRRGRGGGGPRAAAPPDDAGAGRGAAAGAGQAVRRRPPHHPVRHAQPVAGARRPRRHLPAGADRPDPVPAARRPADVGPLAGRRPRGPQRLHGGLGHPRRAAARPGRPAG